MVAGALSRHIDSQNKHWLLPVPYDICTVRLDWKRVGPARWPVDFNHLTSHYLTNLCHSIVVCARLPRWAANGMCSSVLSARNCSRNAANGKTATASPACAKPSRKRDLTRNAELGTRKKTAALCRRFLFRVRLFLYFCVSHSNFQMSGTIKVAMRKTEALFELSVLCFRVPRSALRV